MSLREMLRVFGIIAILIGGLASRSDVASVPSGLSAFHNLADLGMFQRVGTILVGAGAGLLLASRLVKRDGRA